MLLYCIFWLSIFNRTCMTCFFITPGLNLCWYWWRKPAPNRPSFAPWIERMSLENAVGAISLHTWFAAVCTSEMICQWYHMNRPDNLTVLMYPWPEKSENAIPSVMYGLYVKWRSLASVMRRVWCESHVFVEASTQHKQSEAYGIHWLTTPDSSFAHFRDVHRTMEFMNLTPRFWHFALRFARGPMRSFCQGKRLVLTCLSLCYCPRFSVLMVAYAV